MRKVGFGVLWFIVLFIGFCAVGGMVAGAIAGGKDPANAAQVGQAAGAAFGQQYGGLLLLVALLVAGVGSYAEILPGTKPKKN